jgi:sialate O-acetylesterase
MQKRFSPSLAGSMPLLAALAMFCWSPLSSWADPVLPHLLTDHMVLQRDREIHIWGKADPGEKITVTLAQKTAASSDTDASGKWSVHLPSMTAGGPFTLAVVGKKTVLVKDVMIGEVWIASGQSNMAFVLSDSLGATEEIPKADYPQMRLFTVPKKIALDRQWDTLPAAWQICTPETVKDFSAVAYYFARDLHRSLNVPIGIIETAWPGTTIEEWIDPTFLHETQAPISTTKPADDSSQVVTHPMGRSPFDLQFDDFELIRDPSNPGTVFSTFDDGTSRNTMGGSWSYNWQDGPETSFDLVAPGRGGAGFAARVAGKMDGSDDSRLTERFKPDNSPVDLSSYIGIRFWVRGDGSFQVRTLQPTISDWDNYGTPLFQASPHWKPVVVLFRDLRQEGWGVSKDFTPQSLVGFAIENFPASGYPPLPPSGLYEGMITPLDPYAFRGAIWYQGESNALQAYQYRKLLPALIQSWRTSWRQGDFPFLIVQLPNHGAIPDEPSESAWAEMREAQLLTTKQVPNTGIAVTIDVGDPKDVHPHRKAEVGQRLALWSLGTTYKKPIIYSGPLYQSMAVEGNKIRIRFADTGSGLEARDPSSPLVGFATAGADKQFHWAQATIDGSSAIVSSPDVPSPVAVRYAWGDSPRCNLFNKEGLPASPFRTDDWPGITVKSLQ